MDKKHQEEPPPDTRQPVSLKISARKKETTTRRISQGDIFCDIEIIEHIGIDKSILSVKKISFPFVICLNQECDLENDFNKNNPTMCDNNLLHIAIAPAFIFDQFLSGTHWGDIFSRNSAQKRKDTTIRKVIDNEIPRYHYLKFPEKNMPELIIDFKHFFTINRCTLYDQIDKRICSIDNLFREKINQRFSYYISRIGLPEHVA